MLVVFWSCLALFLHSYVGYPLLMRGLVRRDNRLRPVWEDLADPDLPVVSVICSLHNEEQVAEQKLETVLRSHYPRHKLFLFWGSDASSDRTNELLEARAAKEAGFFFFPYPHRRGKPGVVNDLVAKAKARFGSGDRHILILTDANVLFEETTIWQLVRHFRSPEIGLVDARMIPTGMTGAGISRAENTYISSEVLLKHAEGRVWGAMMGPFGGCFALRSDLFLPVPANFLVDDFFLAMHVLERGSQAINDLEARCYEAVSHDIREEYRRKRRIAAGNFQNLVRFRRLWWPPLTRVGFAFFSHKVIRWIGPFLMLGTWLSAGVLALFGNLFFICMFLLMTLAGVLLIGADVALSKSNINWLPLRGFRYFLSMNLALVEGFWQYKKGIESNVWQPTKRQQGSETPHH